MGAQLTLQDGAEVNPGDTIAKISREVYKTRDITGGLPRGAEMFEASRPEDTAGVTEHAGGGVFGGIRRAKRGGGRGAGAGLACGAGWPGVSTSGLCQPVRRAK